MRLKRPMYSSHNPKGPTSGKDVAIAKFAVHRYETNLLPKPTTGFTEDFGPALYDALHTVIQPNEGIDASGDIGQATWDVLWEYLDAYRRSQYVAFKVPSVPKPDPMPNLGPVCMGDPSILDFDPTHNTDGIADYPAFDTGWITGRTVIAPEKIVVTRASGSQPGDACFARGESKLEYWFGHLQVAPSVGVTIKKGGYVGRIIAQQAPHVHIGIDARPLIGKSLLYGSTGRGPDYTHGSPRLRVQLKEALSL